jgi:hypothetical protein
LIQVQIIGGGPAGSAAALAALRDGAGVEICEQSSLPRHKVCGEFLSPEVADQLDRLGVLPGFAGLAPARVNRAALFLGNREKRWNLSEPGFGLSRFAFDQFLMETAVKRGAVVKRERAHPRPGRVVWAAGRSGKEPKGGRLFGFKAHFLGPADDCVSLFFFSGAYVGLNAIEDEKTNVCGIAPEHLLRRFGFAIDPLLRLSAPLKSRLAGMTRQMDWIHTGPLLYRDGFDAAGSSGMYAAGDALGFVDPFTGTGMLGALVTGRLAGIAAARGDETRAHLNACRRALHFQYRAAGLLRAAVESGWAEWLAPFVPGPLLFRVTRPKVA